MDPEKSISSTSLEKNQAEPVTIDTGVGSVGVPEDSHSAGIIDPVIEKQICRSLDIRLLPLLAMMYLFNSLDKSNLGNAKTDGMDKDLHLINNQYNILLSVFYVPYVLFAFPVAMLGKRYGASIVLPILMFGFGSMCLIAAACRNFGGLMAVRWFLGTFEAAFFPLVIYYLTTFYRRGELARRLAIFYAASNIASAFSGLLSFGVFQIHHSTIQGWRYLFIIEGAATVIMSSFAFFFLPRDITRCKFLTDEQREIGFLRIQRDSSSVVNEKLDIKKALKVFSHPVAVVWVMIEMCLGVPLQSVSLFLPQIVARLGYSTVKTNLYTVAPNVSGALVLLILAFSSDFTRYRFPFIAAGFAFPVIGFIIYASIDVLHSTGAAYFACFLMTAGTAAPSVLLSTWYNNNTPAESRRAALTAVGVPMANVMGLVSSNIFLNKDAPVYLPALGTTAAFGGVGLVLTICLGLWMIYDNKRRDQRQGVKLRVQDVSTEILSEGPAHPSYRWFL
ncbi:major facilitator superfamily domain-containing protein [Lipomyces tetrasporus]|uniref:Major facilitator superfamily domain-containing protein n=1 Tax=Lipomyces tetrasporus TaxID=54092 RepID=A0AAD7VR58_9ASCO|nr:major facilitator superfamily domain-containing protein [Lipomyces tetrasporus]KAJ8098289.1 major facilitator superfamily domain-containing protein [Lipomyces tetrasporus]